MQPRQIYPALLVGGYDVRYLAPLLGKRLNGMALEASLLNLRSSACLIRGWAFLPERASAGHALSLALTGKLQKPSGVRKIAKSKATLELRAFSIRQLFERRVQVKIK